MKHVHPSGFAVVTTGVGGWDKANRGTLGGGDLWSSQEMGAGGREGCPMSSVAGLKMRRGMCLKEQKER